MRTLADRLAEQFVEGTPSTSGTVSIFWPGLVPRNFLFLAIVLVHGFRRLAPPY